MVITVCLKAGLETSSWTMVISFFSLLAPAPCNLLPDPQFYTTTDAFDVFYVLLISVDLFMVCSHRACNCKPTDMTCLSCSHELSAFAWTWPENTLATLKQKLKCFSFFRFLHFQFSHIAIWGSIGLWVVFFVIYSSLWPLIPLAPDMSGEVNTCMCSYAFLPIYSTSTSSGPKKLLL